MNILSVTFGTADILWTKYECTSYAVNTWEIGVDFMVKENFIYVGIDLHKETHTAVMIDWYNNKLGEITFPNRPADFPKLVTKVKKCNTDAKEVV